MAGRETTVLTFGIRKKPNEERTLEIRNDAGDLIDPDSVLEFFNPPGEVFVTDNEDGTITITSSDL